MSVTIPSYRCPVESPRANRADRHLSQNLKENLGAVDVKLTPEEVEEVRKIAVAADAAKEERYPPGMTGVLFGDTPPLPK